MIFRYLILDDFGDPIRKFRTRHEAKLYILNKPNHIIRRLAPKPKENPFDLIKEEPPF